MTFEEKLQATLDDGTLIDARSANGKRIKCILDLPAGDQRRKRVLARMERHAKVHLNTTGPVDWRKVKAVDWQSVFELIIRLLPILLALFGL